MNRTSLRQEEPAIKRYRGSWAAFLWVILFLLLHLYWVLVGDFGLGPMPRRPDIGNLPQLIFTTVVTIMFIVGPFVPLAMAGRWVRLVPSWMLLGASWIAAILLGLRGAAGLVDQFLRRSGLSEGGLTGLSYEQVLGRADPPLISHLLSVANDLYFCLGSLLFVLASREFALRLRLEGRAG